MRLCCPLQRGVRRQVGGVRGALRLLALAREDFGGPWTEPTNRVYPIGWIRFNVVWTAIAEFDRVFSEGDILWGKMPAPRRVETAVAAVK